MKIFGTQRPNLYKFSAPEYDITNGCNTIRIGTLWGFRKEENDYLRDEGEGQFEYSVKFPKMTPVSKEWISEFEVRADATSFVEGMILKGDQVFVEGFKLAGSEVNGWVYCTSASPSAAGNVSEAHSNKWIINGEQVDSFGKYLASLLWESVDASDLPSQLTEQRSLQQLSRELSMQIEIKPVSYEDRRIEIGSELEFPVQKLRELKNHIPFIKPKKFKSEQEVRFAFWLVHNDRKISINDNAKIISLRPIDRFIGAFK